MGFPDEPAQLPFMNCLEAPAGEGLTDRKRGVLIAGELKLRFPLLGRLFLHALMHVGASQHVMQLYVVWLCLVPPAGLGYSRIKLAGMNQCPRQRLRLGKRIKFHSFLRLLESFVRSLQSLQNRSTEVV